MKQTKSEPGKFPATASSRLSSHLTAEQMEAMLRESPYRKQAGKHLESCAACHDEVESLSKVLGLFRASSEAYAEKRQTVRGPVQGLEGRRVRATTPWRWPSLTAGLAAGALACGLVTAPLVHRMTAHPAASGVVGDPAPARTVEMSDEALLEGVQEDLASSLPAPLQLLAAASGMGESGRSTSKQAEKATGSRGSSAGSH